MNVHILMGVFTEVGHTVLGVYASADKANTLCGELVAAQKERPRYPFHLGLTNHLTNEDVEEIGRKFDAAVAMWEFHHPHPQWSQYDDYVVVEKVVTE